MFDAFAIAIPVGMAVQRVGCLLVGCCSGNTTTLPWGLHYGKFSPAFYHQVQSGIIDSSAAHTVGVHPIPLYIIFYCLLVSFLVWKNKTRFKAPGNLTLFSISLLFAARFIVEFLRNPFTNGSLGSIFLGLKLIQWSLIGFIIIFVLILVIREKRFKSKNIPNPLSSSNNLVNISYIFSLSLILYTGKNWFIPIEKISLLLIIVPITLVLIWQLFHQLTASGYRLASIALVVLSFIIMSQTMDISETPDSTDRFVPEAWNSFGFGYAGGKYNEVDYGCNGEITGITKHTYNVGKAEYNRYFILKKNQMGTIGLRGYYGHDVINSSTKRPQYYDSKSPIYDINPYFIYDFKNVGIGVGLHLGKLDISGFYNTDFLPMFYFRAGSRNNIYGEFYVFDQSLLYTPASLYRVGLGINLGKDFNSLHFGFAEVHEQPALYLASRFTIGNNFLLEPNMSFQFGDGKGFQGGFGVHYMFGRSPIKRK